MAIAGFCTLAQHLPLVASLPISVHTLLTQSRKPHIYVDGWNLPFLLAPFWLLWAEVLGIAGTDHNTARGVHTHLQEGLPQCEGMIQLLPSLHLFAGPFLVFFDS